MAALGIAAVSPGAPFDEGTFSGGSLGLLSALDRRGVLIGAVSGALPKPLDLALAAAFYSSDRLQWHQRRRLNPPRRIGMSALAAMRLRRIARRPDVILQIGAYYDLRGRLQPRLRASYHDGNLAVGLTRRIGTIDPSSALARSTFAYERRVYDGLDLILTMSDWLRESFIDSFGQPEDKVVTVGAGANAPVPEHIPRRESSSAPRFLFVGRDFERKGGPAILDAFRRVKNEIPRAEFVIVGPSHRPKGLTEGVEFIGSVPREIAGGEKRLAAIYEQATVFVMPSLYEPFGFVFLEAMGWALPCIGSSVCAMPEIVEDGTTGFIVPPGDVDALAERMLALGHDPERAAVMGQRGRDRFLRDYTWDAVAERIEHEVRQRLPGPLEDGSRVGGGVFQ